MAIHRSGCSTSGGVSASIRSRAEREFVFSDFDYVEIVLDTTPHPKAISIGVDPYIMIRPEGRWHVPGHPGALRDPAGHASLRREAARKGARMSSVIDLRAYVNPSVIQTLVLVDLQQEYIASPRVLALEETKGALANCRAALAHARAMGLPVAFARWIDRTPLFNKATRVLALDRGLRAARRRHDLRAQPAVLLCQRRFRRGDELAAAAASCSRALPARRPVLRPRSTAFHRGHTVTYLADASASHALDDIAANDVHRVVSNVAGLYGDVITTRNWIARTSRRNSWKGLGDGNEQGRTA